MSLTSVPLVLLSAAIHVLWNLYTKQSRQPLTFSMIKGFLLIGISAALLPFFSLVAVPAEVWLLVMITAPVHALYIFSLSKAYETGDISYVYPIARSAPAFVPVVAFLVLGERISTRGILGIAIVVVSVFALQFRDDTGTELRKMALSLRRRESVWAFVTLGAVVGYSIIDKAAMVRMGRVDEIAAVLRGPLFFILHISLTYILFSVFMIVRRTDSAIEVIRNEWRRVFVAALGTMASYSLILHVMQTEEVSYIVALRQSSVLLAVLAGWFVMKEGHIRSRLPAAAAMAIGLCLVAAG